ncbi:MAG: alpha/beta hydrolase [Bacillota bacterium]|nr:alpha/beta hydrolase [Bacillota bacterium]
MIVFLSFLPVFLIVLSVLHYSFRSAAKYSHGLLLLVAVPQDQTTYPDVQRVVSDYRRSLHRLSLSMGLLLFGFLALMLFPPVGDYVGLFVVLLMAILILPISLYNSHLNRYRNRLLDVKRREAWVTEEEHVLRADLQTSRLKNQKTPHSLLFVIPIAVSIGIFLLLTKPQIGSLMTILLLANLSVHLVSLILHLVIVRSPAKFYSENGEANRRLNQEYRRSWSLAYLGVSFAQCLFFLGVAQLYLGQSDPVHPLRATTFWLLIIAAGVLPAILFTLAYARVRRLENRLLQGFDLGIAESDRHFVYDGIWGFRYCNPDNPAAVVPKPLGIGQALNIGHPNGRRIYRVGKVFVIAVLLCLAVLIGFEDLVSPVLQVSDDAVEVTRTLYPYRVPVDRIARIELLESPVAELKLFRVLGSATGRLLRGVFETKTDAAARVYLFRRQAPQIVFYLEGEDGKTLYFNYEDPAQTAALWNRLKEVFPDKVSGVDPAGPRPSQATTREELRARIRASEIDYSVPAGNGSLHAVLNLPFTPSGADATPPVVLFIGGSGMSTKAGPANLNLDIAAHLLEHGIATLRYDERGGGESASVVDVAKEEDMVIEDFVDDVVSLLRKLSGDERVGDLYIAGHSEGALIGALAAQQVPVSGILTMAGAGRPIDELIMEQLRANPNNPKEILDTSEAILEGLKKGERTSEVPQILMALFRPSVQPYLISWMKYHPGEELAKLGDAKILIVQGANDMQVGVEDAEALHAATKGKLLVFPEMTHMMKDCTVPYSEIYRSQSKAAEYIKVYRDDSLPVNAQLLEAMVDWIRH